MTGSPFVGRSLGRVEDARFLTGQGEYVADLRLEGSAEAAFVRSPLAHGTIEAVDVRAALKLDGVHAVYTADTLPPHSPLVDSVAIEGLLKTPQFPLARGRVRYVGEPVAIVVARDRYVAEDAIALIDVAYEELDIVMTTTDAVSANAPILFPELGTNVVYHDTKTFGDPAAALAAADHVYTSEFSGGRLTAVPMETRGCVARFDAGRGALTVWSSTQGHHLLRRRLATTTGVSERRIRVIAPDVGGGFGQKIPASPEEIAVALAAIDVKRPVRWIEDRRENLIAAPQAKEQHITTEIGMDRDGRFLAMRARVSGDAGAFSFNPASALIEPYLSALLMPSVYRFEHFECEIMATLTNKSPVSPYRGVGWTTSHTARELLIDRIAHDRGWDPARLRRDNMIRSDEFPYTNIVGMVYESGSFQESLDEALRLIDYEGFRSEQHQPATDGRVRGVGISPYVEPNGWGSEGAAQTHWAFASYDSATVTMDPSGEVTVAVGAPSQGQGHETTLAQVTADAIGTTPESVQVQNNDTTSTPVSIAGTRASRVAVVLGGAAVLAGRELKDRLRKVAAHMLEAAPDDIVIEDGSVRVAGDTAQRVTIADVAAAAHFDPGLRATYPDPLLSVQRFHDPGATYSNGSIIATVEVDPATGHVEVVDLVAVEDCGRIINPMIVDGQIRGAAAQGIGCALLEAVAYDEYGQPLATTLMDYLIPLAADLPSFTIGHLESLSPNTMNGVKGMGESGMIAVPAAVANAVADAMPGHGMIDHLPVSIEQVASAFDLDRGVNAATAATGGIAAS